MTLLARRRDELRRERTPQEPLEKRRSIAVRPPQPRPSFLHVQAALGNHATDRLLRSTAVLAKRRGEPLPVDPALGEDGRDDLLAHALAAPTSRNSGLAYEPTCTRRARPRPTAG